MKRTPFFFFLVLALEGLVGPHRTFQLQLLQRYWSGHSLGLLWCWKVCLGNEPRLFHRFWNCSYVSCTYINQFVSLMNCSLYRYTLSLSLVNSFCLKPISSAGTGGAAIATLFWLTCAQCHLPSIYCEPVFLFRAGISLLEAAYIGRLFSSSQPLCVFWLVN